MSVCPCLAVSVRDALRVEGKAAVEDRLVALEARMAAMGGAYEFNEKVFAAIRTVVAVEHKHSGGRGESAGAGGEGGESCSGIGCSNKQSGNI